LREIDHFGTPPPLLLRQVVVEATGEGEEERDGVAGKMLVVAAAHIGDDDVQMYSQGIMCKMIAQCTQQGKSIDEAIAFCEGELEGYMRS
jgi:hypothetical protein